MAESLNAPAWPHLVALTEARRGTPSHPIGRHIVADAADRVRIAKVLKIEAIEALEADLALSAWRDGAQVEGAWRARVVQICGISLDPFETELSGEFVVTVVPQGSALAEPPAGPEIILDPMAEDPPDVLEGDEIDIGGYVLEHLALEIDPFPRKPGVAYEAPPETQPPSPFQALASLKSPRQGSKG